jgi:hypothetical protein
VRGFFRGRREEHGLERELRAQRPQPRSELVQAIEDRVSESRRPARGGFRLAMVGALTACMLVALGAVGGLGQAYTTVGDVAVTAKRIVKKKGPKIIKKSAAKSQYGKPAKKAKKKVAKKAKKKVAAKKNVKAKRQVRRAGRPRFTG